MIKQEKLAAIAKQVANCQRCGLFKNATHPVPGDGPATAKVIFIGEAPGFHEDRKGIPFCGAAGKLLEQLLELVGLKRKDVFIGNMVKHRPLGNRDPMPEEIEACRPFLDKQIKIINPKVIVTLGRFSMNKFLPGEFISQNHGRARLVDYVGNKRIVIPMYHPAAALRSGKIMEELKVDFQKISEFLQTPKSEDVENQPKELELENQEEQLKIL